jgi:hypothetical protein
MLLKFQLLVSLINGISGMFQNHPFFCLKRLSTITVTYRVVKRILKFNVLKFIFLKMGLHYKLVVILVIML